MLGRIAEAPGTNCAGYLAVMCLSMGGTSASVRWVDPLRVRDCYDSPPRALMRWLTGTRWVASKADIGRLIAAWAYGTTCEQFIESIDGREKPYNDPTRLDAYINQFILE